MIDVFILAFPMRSRITVLCLLVTGIFAFECTFSIIMQHYAHYLSFFTIRGTLGQWNYNAIQIIELFMFRLLDVN